MNITVFIRARHKVYEMLLAPKQYRFGTSRLCLAGCNFKSNVPVVYVRPAILALNFGLKSFDSRNSGKKWVFRKSIWKGFINKDLA